MTSKRWGWTRHLAVLGGLEMVFAGVAVVGILLTTAALGVLDGAIALAVGAVVLIGVGMLLLRFSSRNGGMLDRRHTAARKSVYRAQYQRR